MSSISSAACLIIGDEILNGKIQDTNSNYFARKCFDIGISVQNITVVPDDEEEIVDAIQRLSKKYDFIVTSGGIGSTHDDITYDSIGKAFELPVVVHQPTAERMKRLSKSKHRLENAPKEVLDAQLRMATLPIGDNVEYLYVLDDSWVPLVAINSKVFIFPGVPGLFTQLLDALIPFIKSRVDSPVQTRYFVSTKLLESQIAPYLRKLQASVDTKNIKIGSYPHLKQLSVTVSIIGPSDEDEELRKIVKQVEENVSGEEVSPEKEALSLD